MRIFSFVTFFAAMLLFFTSCGNEKDENIYEESNDYVYEEPDNAHDHYQTRPDNSGQNDETDDQNSDQSNDTGTDEDTEMNDSDSDTETPDETVNPTKNMVLIPAGKAWVGCNENQENDCPAFELPYHEITTKAYYIDKYEVTVEDYAKCIADGACGEEGSAYDTYGASTFCNMKNNKDDHPMNCISFFGANAYCEWAGKRLPSEAEWEKAARGGCDIHGDDKCENDSYIYTWGNEGTPDCNKVNMANSAADWGCGTDSTSKGGTHSNGDSPYLCSDMLGNLYEWVADSWSEDHTDAPTDGSSRGVPDSYATIKGGSFMQYEAAQFRVSFRAKQDTTEILYSRGFRCVMDAEE